MSDSLRSAPAAVPARRGVAEYLDILARWRTPVIAWTLCAGVLAAVYLWFFVPNVYESKAAIKSSTISSINGTNIGSMLNVKGVGDLGGMLGLGQQRNDLEQYVGVLSSRSVMTEIVEHYHLQADFGEKYFEDALKDFQDQVKFESERETQILRVAVQDTSPRRAQAICKDLIFLLDSVNKVMSKRNAQGAREYLELRFNQCTRELANAEDSLRAFQMRYKVYDMKDQATATIKVAAGLEGEIVLKEVQANMLARSLGAEDADARRLRDEVEELKRQRKQMDSGMDLQGAFQSMVPFGTAPQVGMDFFRRYRNVEIQQKLFALLYPMYEQAKVDEERNTPTVLVLDTPSFPERKVKPKRTLILLGVMAVMAVFVFLIALLVENVRAFSDRDPARYGMMRGALRKVLPSYFVRWM